ncbi:TIGR03619 family F420-dependent LLM class oxidoreductase [Candidatus Nephthysia bennettiae]
MKPMRFGVALPTCTEGMIYPVPFATPDDVVRVALEAERLGYYAVMGNDHMTTQKYVRERWPDPPNFYELLVTYAYCAAHTTRIRLMTGVIVMPMRQPVLLAKQVATLDQFSRGRVILGVGVGAYREEFEATYPQLKAIPRAELVEEGIRSLRVLFTERQASFTGKHYQFEAVEMYPKPLQLPLPIYSSGNAEGSIRRAAELCEGWLPAGMGPLRIAEGRDKIRAYAEAAGRNPDAIEIAPQLVVCIGRTVEEAERVFKRSQAYEHLVSLQQSTLKGFDIDSYVAMNLIGSVDEVCERVDAYRQAGADHLPGLLFVANTVEEMIQQSQLFAETVIPNFSGEGPVA